MVPVLIQPGQTRPRRMQSSMRMSRMREDCNPAQKREMTRTRETPQTKRSEGCKRVLSV